jgi:hypothetical protein
MRAKHGLCLEIAGSMPAARRHVRSTGLCLEPALPIIIFLAEAYFIVLNLDLPDYEIPDRSRAVPWSVIFS